MHLEYYSHAIKTTVLFILGALNISHILYELVCWREQMSYYHNHEQYCTAYCTSVLTSAYCTSVLLLYCALAYKLLGSVDFFSSVSLFWGSSVYFLSINYTRKVNILMNILLLLNMI